jgi:hypothetical protein
MTSHSIVTRVHEPCRRDPGTPGAAAQSFLLLIRERSIDHLELAILILTRRVLLSFGRHVRAAFWAGREGRLPRPDEVTRIGLLELGIARFRESKTRLWTFAPAHIGRQRRDELEIVRVKTKDAQESGELREIAADNPLQVRRSATAPVIKVLRCEQIHFDENVDGRDHLPALQNRGNRVFDSREKPVFTKVRDGDLWFRRTHYICLPAMSRYLFVFHACIIA